MKVLKSGEQEEEEFSDTTHERYAMNRECHKKRGEVCKLMSSRMRDIDRRTLSGGAKLTSLKKRQSRNDDGEENYQANIMNRKTLVVYQ